MILVALGVVASCGPSARETTGGDGGLVGGVCTPGQTSCSGQEILNCVNGAFVAGMTCANVCDPTLGCVLCNPGTGTCNGEVSHACNADGMGYSDITCDAAEGVMCGASGTCEGACAPASLGSSYIGCDYYLTVTGNLVGTEFDFAVALSNTGSSPATVTISGGALTTPTTVTVQPNTVKVQNLPWVISLKFCNEPTTSNDCATTDALATKGAYHVESNSPVTVYQFNSLEYQLANGDFSFSNDASLMLPTNVWNNEYYVAAYTAENLDGDTYGSLLAVTAAQDGTNVTITPKAASVANGGAPAFAANAAKTVMLNAGDVIEISTASGDMTGSHVMSDKPVEVFGGHVCADIPDANTTACDHLEESMFSVDALGQNYLVNAPTLGDASNLPANNQVVRIIATAPNTALTYDPPQTGAAATIAAAGDFVTVTSSASYLLHADQKVLVAQYMVGQGNGSNGDPSETLAVPVEQWRDSYLFHAPVSYDTNFVDISAPVGASVTLDGAQVMFNAIGSNGYAIARKALTLGPSNDGSHSITGTMPFGIQVYGYGDNTSYWYPGGLNLTSVVISDKHPTTTHAAAPVMLAPGN